MKNKKLWLSVGLIILVAGGAIATTAAYFTAQRTASTNKFTAGTLDLNVQSNGVANEPFVVENVGDGSSLSGSKTWTVKNTGTLPGKLLISLQNVVNKENGCNDQEKIAEPACEANNEGEFGGVVNLTMALDGVDKVSSTLATANQSKIGVDWSNLAQIVIPPGGEKTVTAKWAAPENAYGNEVQSDTLEYDVNFRLVQLGSAAQ